MPFACRLTLVALLVAGCGSLSKTSDGGESSDAGVLDVVDGGVTDAGALDGGADAGALDGGADAGSLDGGADAGRRFPLDGGHARVVGLCERVAPELASPMPSYFEVHLDFGADGYDEPQERGRLTQGAQRILMEGTAGGSSGVSEAFAFEVLALCEGADFVKSETMVQYNPPSSKKTDILVRIAEQRVGVSVTRAVAYPPDAGYPVNAARTMFLRDKLQDILVSSMNVVPADAWVKQILLVMAYDEMHAATIRTIWEGLDVTTRADTVLYVVITDGDDRAIYF